MNSFWGSESYFKNKYSEDILSQYKFKNNTITAKTDILIYLSFLLLNNLSGSKNINKHIGK